MKLQKIYRQQWMEAHPRMQSADTDQWYVDFANRLLPVFEKSELTGQMIHKNRAVLYFTWYLEDCVNNSGSWNTFIRLHKQLYGRFLPFYTLTESYADDEINPEDVSFLLSRIVLRLLGIRLTVLCFSSHPMYMRCSMPILNRLPLPVMNPRSGFRMSVPCYPLRVLFWMSCRK